MNLEDARRAATAAIRRRRRLKIALTVGIAVACFGGWLVGYATSAVFPLAAVLLFGGSAVVVASCVALQWHPPGTEEVYVLRARARGLSVDARAVFDSATSAPGRTIALPTDFLGTAELLERELIAPVLSSGNATIYRAAKVVVPEDFGGLADQCKGARDAFSRIMTAQHAAEEATAASLPPATLCCGPVAPTRRGKAWAGNSLPWQLHADPALVEQLTRGQPVIMDRATWEALPERPLPGRVNIVLTRSEQAAELVMIEGGDMAETFDEALLVARRALVGAPTSEVHVLGGPALFERAMKGADRLYLSETEAGDDGRDAGWVEVRREERKSDRGSRYHLRVLQRPS